MNFKEALKILGIEKYAERIYNSNSHGELFHLVDYITVAEALQDGDCSWFPNWFDDIVKMAEENWERPESIFQHIIPIINECSKPNQ